MTTTIAPPEPACRTNPDLWFAIDTTDRALAIHICRSHCPLYNTCQLEATTDPCRGGVHAGTLYTDTYLPQPSGQQPKPSNRNCPTCAAARPDPALPATSRWDDCGQYKAHQRHLRRGEKPCGPCIQARRDRDTIRRAAKDTRPAITRPAVAA
jgi:hypothetical protein